MLASGRIFVWDASQKMQGEMQGERHMGIVAQMSDAQASVQQNSMAVKRGRMSYAPCHTRSFHTP